MISVEGSRSSLLGYPQENKIKFVNKKYLTDSFFSVKIPEVTRNGRVFTADAAL